MQQRGENFENRRRGSDNRGEQSRRYAGQQDSSDWFEDNDERRDRDRNRSQGYSADWNDDRRMGGRSNYGSDGYSSSRSEGWGGQSKLNNGGRWESRMDEETNSGYGRRGGDYYGAGGRDYRGSQGRQDDVRDRAGSLYDGSM